MPSNTSLDSDRLNRIHVVNVRFDGSRKAYMVSLYDPTHSDTFEIERNEWITYGDWQKRKREGNYY